MNLNLRDPDWTEVLQKRKAEVKKEKLEIQKILYNKLTDEQTAVILVIRYIFLTLVILISMITVCSIGKSATERITKKDIAERLTNIEKHLSSDSLKLYSIDSTLKEHSKKPAELRKETDELKKIEPEKEPQ